MMKFVKRYILRRHTVERELTDLKLRERFKSVHGISIGLYSYGCFDITRVGKNTKIGRYCSFANTASIFTRNHGIEFISTTPYLYNSSLGIVRDEKLPHHQCIIEDDVWVGHNAIILPGARFIGRGSVIGAGAVVTRPGERYSIIGGNPARVLRPRFDEALKEQLESLRWWEWDLDDLRSWIQKDSRLIFHPGSIVHEKPERDQP
jgi:virginiamycin A acetyltransferase